MSNRPIWITGDKFIAGLMELGIVDNDTRRITIDAEVGKPITLTVEKFGDDRLLKLLADGAVVIAHDPEEAVCR
jgi:hypothetical protein